MIEKLHYIKNDPNDTGTTILEVLFDKLNELIDAVNELKEDIEIVKMENRVHKKKIDFIMENSNCNERKQIDEHTEEMISGTTLKELYEK